VAEATVGTAHPARERAVARTTVRERQRGALRRLLELFALTAFAVAQPVLDVTGRSPDFFLYRRPSIWQIRLLVLAIVLGPALGLWVCELVAGLFSGVVARLLHLAFLALLFATIAVEVGKQAHLGAGVALAVVAFVVGVALAVLAARKVGFRQAILYASPAPLVFALLFTVSSPSGALVRGGQRKQTAIPPAPAAVRPPIVFIFLDEFPLRALLDGNGQIDETLYPNFAALQKATTWYPNATGVSGWTPFAAPSMLSGRYPEKAVAASYLAYPQNLFTLLGGTYKVRAYETISQLCPPALCPLGAAGRPTGLKAMAKDTAHIAKQIVSPNPVKGDPTQQFTETATVDMAPVTDKKQLPDAQWLFANAALNQPNRMTEFLADLKPSPQPTLHFLHLLLPHAPWRYLPSGREYQPVPVKFVPPKPEDDKQGTLSSDPVLSVLGKQRLLLQLAYTDNLLGTMIKRLKATGLWDPSLLIVTADHGSGLTPLSRSRKMDDKNPADLTWVPLFLKTPGQQAGKVDLRNEQQVDLMPTIADVLDATIPWQVDGHSLLGPPPTGTEKLWYDIPGVKQQIDTANFAALAHTGLATDIAAVARGREGLFAVGPYRGLVGEKVSALRVGSGAPVRAKLDKALSLDDVDPASGKVPAMLWGTFDGALDVESTWVVAAVNGTVAGTIPAVRDGKGDWRFLGVVDDQYFTKGRADVTLYAVDGTTLHPIAWR
jgi:hypothetical protein